MKILAMKSGHDGQVCFVEDGVLRFSYEAEKDSFPRYDRVHPEGMMKAFQSVKCIPDVLAIGGWIKGWHSVEPSSSAGYFGIDNSGIEVGDINLFGEQKKYFSSTHERSHLLCSYAMSPYPQGKPCYALVWEGNLGDFYLIDEQVQVHHLGSVLADPGNKYCYPFFIADPSFSNDSTHFRFGDAGKLMSLAAYSDRAKNLTDAESALIDKVLNWDGILLQARKSDFEESPYFNIGVTSPEFKQFAGKYTDAIFDKFYQFAKKNLDKSYPLLVSGGCGLNCEWNTKWKDSGLFEDVFVPPCTNDSGSAIGTAVDAQLFYSGNAKLEWDVYAGEEFQEDKEVDSEKFVSVQADDSEIAKFLRKGNVIGWVQDRYEIGPRALGNRSILAEPFHDRTRDKLNEIKKRESYRPVAPICLEEDAHRYFGMNGSSPHMLYFQKVQSERLKAVTHVDGSARVQTVGLQENSKMHSLLEAFRALTGYSVLCNTSLNFNGRGFINRTSDLERYALENKLDGFVINNSFFISKECRYANRQEISENSKEIS